MTKKVSMIKALISNMLKKYGYSKEIVKVQSDGKILVDGQYNKDLNSAYINSAEELIRLGYYTKLIGKRHVIYNTEGKRKDIVVGKQ